MRHGRLVIVLLAAVSMAGCEMVEMVKTVKPVRTFGDDLEFLKQHTDVLVLTDDEGRAQVAVVPAYQGRVMTSTATGTEGASFSKPMARPDLHRKSATVSWASSLTYGPIAIAIAIDVTIDSPPDIIQVGARQAGKA